MNAAEDTWPARFQWPSVALAGASYEYECPDCFVLVKLDRIRHHHVWHREQEHLLGGHAWRHPDCPHCPGFEDPR